MWPFKKKQESAYSNDEVKSLADFMRGFELGLNMASEIDEKVKRQIRDEAINATLARLNGNHKKTN